MKFWFQNAFAKIIIFIFFVIIFSTCLTTPQIKDVSISNLSISLSKMKLTMNVNVDVKNDNLFNIKIKKMNFKVFLNDRFITSIEDSTKIVLVKNNITTITLPLSLRQQDISQNADILMSIVLGEKAQLNIDGEILYQALLIEKTAKINSRSQIN